MLFCTIWGWSQNHCLEKNNLLQKLVSISGTFINHVDKFLIFFDPPPPCNQFYTHNVDHFTKFLNPPLPVHVVYEWPLSVAIQYEFFKSYTGFIVLHMNVNIYFSHDFCKLKNSLKLMHCLKIYSWNQKYWHQKY